MACALAVPLPLAHVRAPVYLASGAGRGKDAAAGAGLVHSRMLGDDRTGAAEAAWGETLGDRLVGTQHLFVAVEPGVASYWIDLAPGKSWSGQKTLSQGACAYRERVLYYARLLSIL